MIKSAGLMAKQVICFDDLVINFIIKYKECFKCIKFIKFTFIPVKSEAICTMFQN